MPPIAFVEPVVEVFRRRVIHDMQRIPLLSIFAPLDHVPGDIMASRIFRHRPVHLDGCRVNGLRLEDANLAGGLGGDVPGVSSQTAWGCYGRNKIAALVASVGAPARIVGDLDGVVLLDGVAQQDEDPAVSDPHIADGNGGIIGVTSGILYCHREVSVGRLVPLVQLLVIAEEDRVAARRRLLELRGLVVDGECQGLGDVALAVAVLGRVRRHLDRDVALPVLVHLYGDLEVNAVVVGVTQHGDRCGTNEFNVSDGEPADRFGKGERHRESRVDFMFTRIVAITTVARQGRVDLDRRPRGEEAHRHDHTVGRGRVGRLDWGRLGCAGPECGEECEGRRGEEDELAHRETPVSGGGKGAYPARNGHEACPTPDAAGRPLHVWKGTRNRENVYPWRPESPKSSRRSVDRPGRAPRGAIRWRSVDRPGRAPRPATR